TLNIEQPRIVVENGGGIGRTVKDWFAEKASSILLNKIYPVSNSLSSSDSEEEEKERENVNLPDLEEIIVKTEPVKAKIIIHKHSLDENKIVEDENLPQIEIHEGTPLRIEEMPKNQIKFGKTLINERIPTLDSTPTREGISSQKRHKKPPKLPKDYAGALLKFSAPTMQAIRAIENSRLKNGQIGNDFKSRLFAKFATNQRFAEIVENNAPPPKKMVSSSIQTSPRQSPIHSIPQKSWRLRRLGCGHESLDSTSSDLNVTRTTTNDASNPSCSANDLDSLYSNTYFDVCFGNYHTDSVPSLMAITPLLPQSSSQIAMANSKKMGERRSSLALKRRFSDKLFFGLFGRRINENPQKPKPKFIVGQQHSRRKRRPLSQSFSSPSFPFINPQCLSPTDKNNKTITSPISIPTTPIIHLTDMAINRKFKLGMTPSPSPAERISNFKQVTKPSTSTENILMQGKRPRRNSRVCGLATIGSNPLGCVPLHHRTLSTRRRFSAYARTKDLF
uniref:Uncharacterized protein n=1 Tax=Meloidogyne floridensis TaxID=298350 RepID=A0A915NKH5_9BILA